MAHTRLDPSAFLSGKQQKRRFAVLTAYDYPGARLLDEAGIDLILVGDSVGMVVLGYEDTTHVTMEEMLHHTRAVARGATKVPIVADLPFASYETKAQAVENAKRLIDAGAHAVKLEGGVDQQEKIAAITASGIPFVGHIGMLPQSVKIEGGYKIKGKTPDAAEQLLNDAKAIEEAGGFAVVLELVTKPVAKQITESVGLVTIGIGSGPDCDAQVLVTHDLIGMFPWFCPKFAKPKAAVHEQITAAVRAYIDEVRQGS